MKKTIVTALVFVSILAFISLTIAKPVINPDIVKNFTPSYDAKDIGRYQAVTVFSSERGISSVVIILDTAEGHLWKWERYVVKDKEDAFLNYQGRVGMTGQMGVTVDRYTIEKGQLKK